METDALIVGAGPVALFAVFELGLLEVGAQVVDSLPYVGGQCLELYADKPIYDIPALPFATGAELIERLQKQIAPFGAGFHLGQQVSAVATRDDGRFDVATDAGQRFIAKAVVIAGRRRLVPAAPAARSKASMPGASGSCSIATRAARRSRGRRVVIVGNGEEAVTAALDAVEGGARQASTLVHRRDDFDAPASRCCRFQAARDERQDRGRHRRRRRASRARATACRACVLDTSDGGTRTLAARRAAGAARLEPEARADRRVGPGAASESS